MPKPLALLIHSVDSSLSSVSKLLEARDFSVHVSRSLEEAERVFSAFRMEQLKYVFADVAVCQAGSWNNLLPRAGANPPQRAVVCYHPRLERALYGWLGHHLRWAEE